MKTNGSQSSHIQVDRQTIETALDDEVASYPHLNNTSTTVVATSEAARGGGCNEEKVGSSGSTSSTSPNAEMMRPKRKQHSESVTQYTMNIFGSKSGHLTHALRTKQYSENECPIDFSIYQSIGA